MSSIYQLSTTAPMREWVHVMLPPFALIHSGKKIAKMVCLNKALEQILRICLRILAMHQPKITLMNNSINTRSFKYLRTIFLPSVHTCSNAFLTFMDTWSKSGPQIFERWCIYRIIWSICTRGVCFWPHTWLVSLNPTSLLIDTFPFYQ